VKRGPVSSAKRGEGIRSSFLSPSIHKYNPLFQKYLISNSNKIFTIHLLQNELGKILFTTRPRPITFISPLLCPTTPRSNNKHSGRSHPNHCSHHDNENGPLLQSLPKGRYRVRSAQKMRQMRGDILLFCRVPGTRLASPPTLLRESMVG
jgi:hypothetical protein